MVGDVPLPSASPATADGLEHQQQQDRAQGSYEHRAEIELVDALPARRLRERPTEERAEHADGDGVQATAPLVSHDAAGDEAGDQANEDPREDVHSPHSTAGTARREYDSRSEPGRA